MNLVHLRSCRSQGAWGDHAESKEMRLKGLGCAVLTFYPRCSGRLFGVSRRGMIPPDFIFVPWVSPWRQHTAQIWARVLRSMIRFPEAVLCCACHRGPAGYGVLVAICVGIHLSIGSRVCLVALDKYRISVFSVTHHGKTRVVLCTVRINAFLFTHTHNFFFPSETISYHWKSIYDLLLSPYPSLFVAAEYFFFHSA